MRTVGGDQGGVEPLVLDFERACLRFRRQAGSSEEGCKMMDRPKGENKLFDTVDWREDESMLRKCTGGRLMFVRQKTATWPPPMQAGGPTRARV